MTVEKETAQVPETLNPLVPVLVPLVLAAVVAGFLLNHFFGEAALRGDNPVAHLENLSEASGLHYAARSEAYFAEKRLGGGLVCFDFDGDGAEDLFFVGRNDYDAAGVEPAGGLSALYKNDGRGHFTDVTPGSGLDVPFVGMSAAAGDFDNDGLPDLFVTCVGRNHLFRNEGRGRFREVSGGAGISEDDNRWSTGAVWLDIDGDGWLDLVVAHYAAWPTELTLQMAISIDTLGRSYGAPSGFYGLFPSVYRNRGDGTLELLEKPTGIGTIDTQTGTPARGAVALVPLDTNGDGLLDLLVLYSDNHSDLFVSLGGGRFSLAPREVENRNEGGALDLLATSSFPLNHSSGDPRWDVWQERMRSAIRAGSERARLPAEPAGFVLFDYDHEGPPACFGRLLLEVPGEGERDPVPSLYLNRGDRWVRTKRPAEARGEGDEKWGSANGLACGDFDGDGNIDLAVTRLGEQSLLLRNTQRGAAPWISVELRALLAGAVCGAKVEVHTPGKTWTQTYAPAMGPFSQSSSTLWFGLGADSRAQRVVVRWPDGRSQELLPDAINKHWVIEKAK